MVRIVNGYNIQGGVMFIEAVGLSSDTKPTEGIATGSKFTEVDTVAVCSRTYNRCGIRSFFVCPSNH